MKTRRAVLCVAFVAGIAATEVGGESAAGPGPSRNDRTIEHVLNRLGYGPRPGDIERVQAMGVSRYIDLQLHPERLDDHGMAPASPV